MSLSIYNIIRSYSYSSACAVDDWHCNLHLLLTTGMWKYEFNSFFVQETRILLFPVSLIWTVISLRVGTIAMYSDPRPSCFTLHKRMKNSDGSEEEIYVDYFNILSKGILIWGMGQGKKEKKNEDAYLRSPTFSSCFWRPCSLHAKM